MTRVSKLVVILLSLALSSSVRSAYEPMDIEVIKVINTAAANVNTTAVTEFNNINTTATINTNTDVFTSVTTNGVVCAPGTYLVDVILYHEFTTSVNNNQRVNPSVEVTVDGTGTGIIGADGFVRASNSHNPLGHDEASTSVSDVVTFTSASKIGFQTQALATTGVNVPAPVGQSAMRIVRIDD